MISNYTQKVSGDTSKASGYLVRRSSIIVVNLCSSSSMIDHGDG